MLFSIAIVPLHWIFAKEVSVGGFTPIRLPPSQLWLRPNTDDAALFSSTQLGNIAPTKQTLACFGSASGLMCNIAKSNIYPICCDDLDLHALLPQILLYMLHFPCTYLALPLHFRRIALVNWATVSCPKHLGDLGVIDLKNFGWAMRLG